jgi:hypothetical protein
MQMPEAPTDIRYVAKNMRLDLRLIAEMIPAARSCSTSAAATAP